MGRPRPLPRGTAGLLLAAALACGAVAAAPLCAGGACGEPRALEDGVVEWPADDPVEDGVELLQMQTKQTTRMRAAGETQSLEEAAQTLEKDTRVLHSLMETRGSAASELGSRQRIELPSDLLPPAQDSSQNLVSPPAQASSPALAAERSALREQLQQVTQQRDAALSEAEQAADSLSFVKGELQLALTQAGVAPDATPAPAALLTAPAARAPAPAPAHAAPAVALVADDDADDCPPDIITFHCKVSMPIGAAIWVLFLLAVCGCCGCLGYYGYKASSSPAKPAYPAPNPRGPRPEGRY